jgi:putative chitinase
MNLRAFFNHVRANLFGGTISQEAVTSIEAVLTAWGQYGDGDNRKLAYILATGFHEGDRYRASEEYASGAAYEGRRDLGNVVNGDGVKFKGRGKVVMITGRRNYADWSKRLGIDLIKEPKLAAREDIAARIGVEGMMLGTFTGKKLGDYITPTKADYVNARRVVNGTDKAALIASYAVKFQTAIALGISTENANAPAPEPVVAPEPINITPPPKNTVTPGGAAAGPAVGLAGLIAVLWDHLATFFRGALAWLQ